MTPSDLIGSWKNSIGQDICVTRNIVEPNIIRAFFTFADWDGIQIFENEDYFRLKHWFLKKNISKENFCGKFIILIWYHIDLKRVVTWIRKKEASVTGSKKKKKKLEKFVILILKKIYILVCLLTFKYY